MNWIEDKHIRWSQRCLAVFCGLLIALDISCYWLAGWFTGLRGMPRQYGIFLMIAVYLSSVPGWICLVKLAKLLLNLRMGEVFIEENVKYMMAISRCCLAVAVICLMNCVYYVPFIFVTIAAAFMFLIVRIVADVFRQAILMQHELDLTI